MDEAQTLCSAPSPSWKQRLLHSRSMNAKPITSMAKISQLVNHRTRRFRIHGIVLNTALEMCFQKLT